MIRSETATRQVAARLGLPAHCRRAMAYATVLQLLFAVPAPALELSGVLLHAAGPAGELVGPVWHTESGYGGRPLGFTRWPLPGTRGMPFPFDAHGRLWSQEGRPSLPLWPLSHVTHLFWQFRPGEFPPALVLNLYFNGDIETPGISAIVFDRYGFTHFGPNPAPYTLSLHLDIVANPSTTEYSDGNAVARITAAFFFSSSPSVPETKQWRPSDLVNLDRVGVGRLEPDGLPDGILVYQLDVEPLRVGANARGAGPPTGPWAPRHRSALTLDIGSSTLRENPVATIARPAATVSPSTAAAPRVANQATGSPSPPTPAGTEPTAEPTPPPTTPSPNATTPPARLTPTPGRTPPTSASPAARTTLSRPPSGALTSPTSSALPSKPASVPVRERAPTRSSAGSASTIAIQEKVS